MTIKSNAVGIIFILMVLGMVYAAAGHLFESDSTGVKATVTEPAGILTVTAASSTTTTLTATPTATANTTATSTATPTPTPPPAGAPHIDSFSPPTPVNDTAPATRTFSITVNQTVNISWYFDGAPTNVKTASYPTATNSIAVHNITAVAQNTAGTAMQVWEWNVTAPRPGAPAITFFAPTSPVNDIVGASRTFNITVNQTVDVAWLINGTTVQTNSGVTTAGYTNASAASGVWNVTAVANNTNGSTSNAWIWNIREPPGNVTDLRVAGTGQDYINWTWDNPPGTAGARIIIDNITDIPPTTSNNYKNATGFAPDTQHKIIVIAFDAAGNNATQPWPVNTSNTLPNTLPGTNVIPAGLPSGVAVSFSNVTNGGNTTASFTRTSQVVPGFVPLGNYVNITTSASFAGAVTITLSYTPPAAGFNESNVRLYHLNNSMWEDVTTNLDITGNSVTGEARGLSLFVAGIYPPPGITIIQQPSSFDITVKDSLFFSISVDQAANVTWTVNNNSQGSSLVRAGGSSSFNFSSTTRGNYSIMVEADNTNGTNTQSWNATVHPGSFFGGNRIWDGSRPDEFSLTYTWTPASFSGFYYDINDDVGDESITVRLDSYSDRTIDRDRLVYKTSPQEVSFGYSGFGSYSVIGFMAEKYFAGYTAGSIPPNPTTSIGAKSTLAQGQLHRVLIDDDTRRVVYMGGVLTLQEGYVLKATDIDASARTMLISLIKDGNEVDSTPLSSGQTYVYTKRVGAVSDLPIIMVRFDSVFSGREVQAAFLRGMFQISENYASVNTGNRFGRMEVRSLGGDRIEMSNDESIGLGEGDTEDLMGDIKITVADNSSAVRFALTVEKTGSFEVRSSIYREDDPIEEWTPYNFGMNMGRTSFGFYYDLDEGIGSESLRLAAPLGGSRTIGDGNLIYSTGTQEVGFGYSGFGSYAVTGFLAEKYFAGYTDNSRPPNPKTAIGAKSTLAQGQLHKVLIDDDERRVIYMGSVLTLQEGYVLKATDIDVNARIMLISLLKDGNEVDSTTLAAGETYVYTKRVGAVSDLPIIMVRFDSIFSGKEVQAAFLRGMFQISENYASVNTGNRFGRMEVVSVSRDSIEMRNDGSIGLDNGRIETLMGNIKLKVGDTSDNSLRFYFAVDVTPAMVANLLVIDAPAEANAGDDIKITVTAGGNAVDGADIAIDSSEIGQTDKNGVLNFSIPRTYKGVYNVTATRLGYLKAVKGIRVLEYIERRLSIEAPVTANQFDTIAIKVTSNGTVVIGASLGYDNITIGLTDESGVLNYTLNTSGTHSISASKSGYITVVMDIDVRAPFSEYRALDINISPASVFTNEETLIRSNITNTGTKKDTLPVELVINGTAVDNRSVALAPGEIQEVNFTRKEDKAGNYTVEILGQKGLLEVKQGPFIFSLILLVAIVTGLGIIVIYLATTKGRISFGSIRKFGKKQVEK